MNPEEQRQQPEALYHPDDKGAEKLRGKFNDLGVWKSIIYPRLKEAGLLSSELIDQHVDENKAKTLKKLIEGMNVFIPEFKLLDLTSFM